MEFRETDSFSLEAMTALIDGEEDPYGADDLGISWGQKRQHLLLLDGGRVVGHAGWLPVEFETEGGDGLPGVGLGSVMVHRRRRGDGLGTVMIGEAADRMRQLGRPFGFLFCGTPRVPFYERNGWRRADNPVTVDQPEGPRQMPLETCWTPLRNEASLPDGPLRLRDLPF